MLTGQTFQLYRETDGHSVSTIEYCVEIWVLHTEPVSYQEVLILQYWSPPHVSKLDDIAATSELYKHWELDATLMVHATEWKHDRYHFYWHFTIPTLVAILLAIMICNGYQYLIRNLLHTIHCTTQPAVNSTPGNKSVSPPKLSPEEQPSTSHLQSNGSGRKSEIVTYSVQTVAWNRDFQSTGQPR